MAKKAALSSQIKNQIDRYGLVAWRSVTPLQKDDFKKYQPEQKFTAGTVRCLSHLPATSGRR